MRLAVSAEDKPLEDVTPPLSVLHRTAGAGTTADHAQPPCQRAENAPLHGEGNPFTAATEHRPADEAALDRRPRGRAVAGGPTAASAGYRPWCRLVWVRASSSAVERGVSVSLWCGGRGGRGVRSGSGGDDAVEGSVFPPRGASMPRGALTPHVSAGESRGAGALIPRLRPCPVLRCPRLSAPAWRCSRRTVPGVRALPFRRRSGTPVPGVRLAV